jgi:hypothetical protein
MISDQQKLWPILGIGCVLLIVIIIILWPYRELIGFLVVGLGVLAAVVMLALHIARTWTDVIVKLHEQKLRQERLRPNDRGYYEIPLEGGEVPEFLPSETEHQEGQVPDSRGYTPKEPYIRRWE